MSESFSDLQLSTLSDFISETLGLHFPPGRWPDLERQTRLAATELGVVDLDPFLRGLGSAALSPDEVEILASHLTIAETYFWREPQVFEALRSEILPNLIQARRSGARRLRVWSAGCASGEEAYSLAIALRQALPAREAWQVTLLATDLNPRILRRAQAGRYGEWSFRNAPPKFKETNFTHTEDGRYEIRPEIREMVTFSPLNLVTDAYPSAATNTLAMDLIFCRNVLMYFLPATAQAVGQRFHQALAEGGWLVVGASELSQQVFPQFASVHYPGAIIYRRVAATGLAGPAPGRARPERLQVPAARVAAPTRPANVRIRPATPVAVAALPAPAPVTQAVRSLANQGQLDAALATCELAITQEKLNPVLYYLRATILQELDRVVEAMAELKRALYLDPHFVLAHFVLGNLARRQGQAVLAKKQFENGLVLLGAQDPNDLLPEAEGLTVGRLRQILRATLQTGAFE